MTGATDWSDDWSDQHPAGQPQALDLYAHILLFRKKPQRFKSAFAANPAVLNTSKRCA
jgi:hypothetical protein